MAKPIKKPQFAGVFKFLKTTYGANWQFRWAKTPYFKVGRNGKPESIAAHMWSCIGLWLNLRRVCPALSSLVDSTNVYEILWTHDLGEITNGDISAVAQLQGEGVNKHTIERREIKKMTSSIAKRSQDEILRWVDMFEDKPQAIKKLEPLVAVMVDCLQGNHFCLAFGHDLALHKAIISKVIETRQLPYFRRLVQVLDNKGHIKASKEVKDLLSHHFAEFRKRGVILKIEL